MTGLELVQKQVPRTMKEHGNIFYTELEKDKSDYLVHRG